MFANIVRVNGIRSQICTPQLQTFDIFGGSLMNRPYMKRPKRLVPESERKLTVFPRY